MRVPNCIIAALARITQALIEAQPLWPTYVHLIVSALLPIYTASYASLNCPSSAEPVRRSSKQRKHSSHVKPTHSSHLDAVSTTFMPTADKSSDSDDTCESDIDDSDDMEYTDPRNTTARRRIEGLAPLDAIIYPVVAGCLLTALFFLIKWLDDPSLLSLILNVYFSVFGLFSITEFLSDASNGFVRLVFPTRYIDHGVLFVLDARKRQAAIVGPRSLHDSYRSSPLPGILSRIPLCSSAEQALWSFRHLVKCTMVLTVNIHNTGSIRANFRLSNLLCFLTAFIAVLYYNLVSRPWWLTNLFGFSLSYGALQLMSPTTFGTGTLVLIGLFFYDIYMVFSTPMMVTVSKSLDVPIKLLFPRPDSLSTPTPTYAMLGLGDIVLPGLMICLALRFDLYMHYMRKQIHSGISTSSDPRVIKAIYKAPSDFSACFWLTSWTNFLLPPLWRSPPLDIDVPSSPLRRFDKPYFRASIVAYVLGLMCTLLSMHIMKHPQPALLYLVPTVLTSLWLTAVIRGELSFFCNYTESTETSDTVACKTGRDSKPSRKTSLSDSTSLAHSSIFSPHKLRSNENVMYSALRRFIRFDPPTPAKSDSTSETSSKHCHPRTTLLSLSLTIPTLACVPKSKLSADGISLLPNSEIDAIASARSDSMMPTAVNRHSRYQNSKADSNDHASREKRPRII